MIKIIEHGTKQKKKCDICGCLFSYEEEDIDTHYSLLTPISKHIKCPQCENYILLESFNALDGLWEEEE